MAIRPSRWFAPTPRSILLAYLALSVTWIALSDRVVAWLFVRPEDLSLVQTFKGWFFVAATSALLGLLLARYERERERQRAVLAEQERTFRLLAERARDVIFRFRVAPDPRLEYVSPAIESALGYPADTLTGDPGFIARLVHPDDPPIFPIDASNVAEAVLVVARLRAADGRWVPFEINVGREPAGEPGVISVEGVARDISERQRADRELHRLNRVLRTMSEVNRALVRATTENSLLATICRAVVEQGEFRFAWVGVIDAATGRPVPVAHAGHEAGYLTADPGAVGPRIRAPGPVARAVAEAHPIICNDIEADPTMAPRREAAIERGYRSMASLPLMGRSGPLGVIAIYAAERGSFGPEEVALLEELAADLAYGVETLRDRAAHEAGEAERLRLATVVGQSHESIVITDADGLIEYVNPAFEQVTGYRREEVMGRNPRLLKSGVQPPAFYAAMWETLLDGRPWMGDVVNRHRDGGLFIEEAVISPVLDGAGSITGYVAVKRDVTAERAAEVRAQAQARERVLIAEALAALRPEDSAEQTAAAICRQVSRLPEASASWLLAVDAGGRTSLVAGVDRSGRRLASSPTAGEQEDRLLASARFGPWVEPVAGDLPNVRHVAYAPLHVEGDVVGLLGIATADPDGGASLTERLPALAEFAGIAGAVLGPSMSRRAAAAVARAEIRAVIDAGSFRPVFQPVVDLVSGEVVGAEALTRFDDGTPPDEAFRAAAQHGLGLDLELATARAALEAARGLPPEIELSLNVSPALVTTGAALARIGEQVVGTRDLLLEVTEHEAIADYAVLRAAVAGMGPTVHLAVDDAGAGFASMRHILELRPGLVKVDRSLIAGIDRDTARQALLAGFRHLARSIDCRLLAEGIETDEELETVRSAGLTLGQGFLLGRPVPVEELRLGRVLALRA